MVRFLFISIILLFAVFGIIWFLKQYRKEKRSLWLGVSFLVAFTGATSLLVVILIQFSDVWFVRMLLFTGAFFITVVFLLFPIVLVFTMLTSGIRLIRREGLSLSHLLSFGFGIAYILYLVIWPILQGFPESGFFDFLYTYLSFCFLFTLMIFVVYTITSILNLLYSRRKKYQYIIVLGSGLKDGYEVTPLLASRVDKGIEAYRQNENSILVLSGGQGHDEKIAEGQAMKNYALKQGVPESAILVEDKSVNTKENLLFSRKLIQHEDNGKGNLLVVTTRYHLLRALLLAKNLGIPCDGRGSKTKLYFSMNAFVREWIAYLVLWRKRYIAILVSSFVLIGLAYLMMGYLGV